MWWFVSLIYAQFLWHDEHAWKTLELYKKKMTGSCSHSHWAKLLSRPTSLNIGLGLFLIPSDHCILFSTKSHVRRLIFLVQIFYGTNNCWFPLARKWPTWKWTWIWIPYGKMEKNVRVTSDGIHAEIHEIWTCVAPAAPPLCHAAVNPCPQSESPWEQWPRN